MAVRRSGGRHAITEYWLEERFGPPLKPIASLMGAKLGTGRTHQVRVHLSHLGCPVVGDPLYGRKRNGPGPESLKLFKRQALHAAVLEFIHPRTKEALSFATELPQDMKKLVAELNDVNKDPNTRGD
jgi:23S rRNA pseudouridine1911/1915/1917 synthase